MLTSYRSLAFIGRVASQFKLRSSPVSSCPPAQRSRHALTSYRSLAFKLCSRTSFQASLHSGLRVRYGLRALRQAPRLPLSHFAHQSALLDYCVLATLNGLARNGRSLRSTPRKIRSPSLVKRSRAKLARLTHSACARYACYGGHQQLRFRTAQRGSQTRSAYALLLWVSRLCSPQSAHSLDYPTYPKSIANP